ncbi:MAG: hypothetical protein J5I94_29805 [Phaeodactylibacter sp.]|nr:hypothetical protein [Phaeodactylibacter sp.]
MAADFRIPLFLVFILGISYLIIQNFAVQSLPAAPPFHLTPTEINEPTVKFNDQIYESWKGILMQLLERLRQGMPLTPEQEEIIDGMAQLLQQYSASMADKAEELITLVQMIQQMQEDWIKQHLDEGQQRTDNEPKPGE